jgi:uncharacterized membrane protein
MESAPDLGNGHRRHRPDYGQLFGLAFTYFGTLSVVWFAVLLWFLYFYAIYLLCTRPHDERFVQVYMLIMSILMLPWGLVLILPFSPARPPLITDAFHPVTTNKDG